MTDNLTTQRRSDNMRRIASKHTKPEMLARRLIHGMGFRYRLHGKDLPGRPDLVFRSRRKVIFVHGCFWHQHEKCADGRTPRSNTEYWSPKLKRNVDRDMSVLIQLNQMGWGVLVVWECELSGAEAIKQTEEVVRRFLAEDFCKS
jgi:DNA mismatch endonuclease (patch repair protein)